MSTSIPQVTPTLMELTPCRVYFKPPGATGFTDLGGTLGNVTIAAKYMKAEIKADQLGETVLDRRVSGTEITVTTELTEVLNKDNWLVVFPHATQVTGATDAIDFLSNIGSGDLSNSGELKLHPQSIDDSDPQYDHTFYKACASAESELVLSPTEQSRLKLVWNVLPDTSVTGQPRFYRFGDADLV